eukprot:g2797.t1
MTVFMTRVENETFVGRPTSANVKTDQSIRAATTHAIMIENENRQHSKDGPIFNIALVKILQAEIQVVAGKRFYIIFQAVTNSEKCENVHRSTDEACVPTADATIQTYKADVWFQAWRNPQYVLNSLVPYKE